MRLPPVEAMLRNCCDAPARIDRDSRPTKAAASPVPRATSQIIRRLASAALEETLAAYQRFGAVPDRDRVLGRLRALGIRRGPRQAHRDTDVGWAALTETEIRVAGLVRDGLTNREIGGRLFISPRTVQTHVSHILQKTGLRSRVEVARAAGAELS